LIKKEVFDSSTIFSTIRDRDGNYILLDIEYNNYRITVGSIYGANTLENTLSHQWAKINTIDHVWTFF